jgi:UDP-2,3-diacylglucosamine pyrophosphatase LpxH
MKYDIKALFISDIHLGSKGSNTKELLSVLKTYSPEYLFIVGDFIDGWLLQKRHYWTQDNTNIIQKILKLSKKGTKIVYITGNHDEFLREYEHLDFGNIHVTDEYIYENMFVVHGDKYDGVVKLHWLGKLGAKGYEIAITVDRFFKKLGFKWSFSKFVKDKVKEAVKFVTRFEEELITQAYKKNCTGVICGHVHKPEDKTINDVRYMNCGDWIENNSYIIQHTTGEFELCYQKNLQ